MNTIKLTSKEILPMIRKCYESDSEHMLQFHITADKGLEYCINRTVFDFVNFNVEIFALYDNNEFIGYFGEEKVGDCKWLTGFFITPEFRKSYKKAFWDTIKDHFDNSFKIGVYSKNIPAKEFLIKNGCNFIHNYSDSDGCVYEYRSFNKDTIENRENI